MDMFARYPVNYQPKPVTAVEPQVNPLYASSQIAPEYFNRGPVFTKPQTANFMPPIYSRQPVFNYQPQQLQQQVQQPIQLKGKSQQLQQHHYQQTKM